MKAILVMGIGNVLLGDEGIGVHIIRELEKDPPWEDVDILDGGTGGFHLLSVIEEYKRIILIDATIDGSSPGRVRLLKPRYAKDFPRTLSAHDIGLKDLIESASLLGRLPEITLITVSISPGQDIGMELSPPVRAAVGEVRNLLEKVIRDGLNN